MAAAQWAGLLSFVRKSGAHLLCHPLQVNHWSDNLGKWEGFAIWDTATHSQPLADRPAQQIKADLTLKFKMRVSSSCHAIPPCALSLPGHSTDPSCVTPGAVLLLLTAHLLHPGFWSVPNKGQARQPRTAQQCLAMDGGCGTLCHAVLAMRRPHTWLTQLVLPAQCRAAILRRSAPCPALLHFTGLLFHGGGVFWLPVIL